MNQHLDLRQQTNSACQKLTRSQRDESDQDGLSSTIVSELDGLPIRPVGEWAYEKIYRLVQYFGIFAGGMKNRWAALKYIEIGSGPGRCLLRENCSEIDGTALAIVRNPHFSSLQRAIYIDASQRVTEILNKRIEALLGAESIAKAMVGNYAKASAICTLFGDLPDGALSLVFIDPTECDVPFETIERVARHLGNADLLVNVALGTDANRNLVSAITLPSHARVREKYERFLGTSGFCAQSDVIELATMEDHTGLRRKFADTYKERLAEIGYVRTAIEPVRHYYYLLFASRSDKGLEFWHKSCRIAPDNQRQLF